MTKRIWYYTAIISTALCAGLIAYFKPQSTYSLIAVIVLLSTSFFFCGAMIYILWDENRKRSVPERLKYILPGDTVQIEYFRFKDKVGPAICQINKPSEQKIIFMITWNNPDAMGCKQDIIELDYNSSMLKRFIELNTDEEPYDDSELTTERAIAFLREELKYSLEEEEYEYTIHLRREIANLLEPQNHEA